MKGFKKKVRFNQYADKRSDFLMVVREKGLNTRGCNNVLENSSSKRRDLKGGADS